MSKLPTIEIDPEEYAREIAKAYKPTQLPDDPGATTKELAKEWGRSEGTARKRIVKMQRAGVLVEGSRSMVDAIGRQYRALVYRLKKEEE